MARNSPEVRAGGTIFGPVFSAMRVATLDDAIEPVNRSPVGNATAIFTSSGKSAREYSSRCEVGMVGVNVEVAHRGRFFPFAGWKNSFFGDPGSLVLTSGSHDVFCDGSRFRNRFAVFPHAREVHTNRVTD